MYVGLPLNASVTPAAAILGQAAANRRLTIYAGAGLSAAAPTSLPGATKLAEALAAALSPVIDLSSVDSTDLIAVSDVAARNEFGLRLLHNALALAADFSSATPNYAHQALALLICEGAVTALEANYDNCIERAAAPERIPVVVTDTDRLEMDASALLKVHGCISRPSSMRLTSAELATAPLFAKAELAARLSVGEVAFIGLGSPADYVRTTVDEFTTRVPNGSLTIVDPGISDWDRSEWRGVFPQLAAPSRVAMDAEAFCDEVLRFYTRELWRRLHEKVSSLDPGHGQRRGLESVAAAMELRNAVWVMRWLRFAAWKYAVGKSALDSSRLFQGLLAMAMLSAGSALRLAAQGIAILEESNAAILLVVADHAPSGSVMADEAARRVADARADGRLVEGTTVVAVCCGHSGRLGADETAVERGSTLAQILASVVRVDESDYLIGGDVDGHLIDSITAGDIVFVTGEPLIDVA
jgi:hypothetical protein